MRLLLSRHRGCSKAKIPWLDRKAVDKLSALAAAAAPAEARIGVVVVDDSYIRELNRTFRGIDRPTDAISFSYTDEPRSGSEDDVTGEVYLSFETIEEKAREQGVPATSFFLRAGVHGMLHILGYLHDSGREAEHMEAEEKRLLLQQLTAEEVEELF